MAKSKMISTRSLCNIGALHTAVWMINRGTTDEHIAEHLFDKYACATLEQFREVVALAHDGIAAAKVFNDLGDDGEFDPSQAPQIPA